eukprot:g44072.t1
MLCDERIIMMLTWNAQKFTRKIIYSRVAMRRLCVASALLLRSSQSSLHASFQASFASLPQRLLSSRRASVPNDKQVSKPSEGKQPQKKKKVPIRGKSVTEILELWSSGKLEASQAVSAFYQLGKAVREAQPEQQQSVVARTRSSPAFASMMGELKLQLPALQGKDVSNTWLGVRDLRVSESRAPSDLQLLQELCKITKEQAVS